MLENATVTQKPRTGRGEAVDKGEGPARGGGESSSRGNVIAMVHEAIAACAKILKLELKADMQTMRDEILAESHTYTNIVTQDLRSTIERQFDTIDNQFQALMESLYNTRKLIKDTPQCLALPPPTPRHSN